MFSGQTVIMKIMGGMTYDEDSVSLSLSRENCPPFIFEQEGDWSEWQYRLVDSERVERERAKKPTPTNDGQESLTVK